MSGTYAVYPAIFGGGGGGSGSLIIGTIDGTPPSSNGAVITGGELYMQSATISVPGLVNISSQSFAGVKTFTSAPNFSSLTASLPLQLDASKNVISAAINLSGSEITGTLGILNGGTGQVTAAAAFNALSPMTTTGDITYEASANTASRLAIGSTGQVLTVSGGVPVWASPSFSGTVTSVNVSGGTTGLTTSGGPVTMSGTITIAGTLAPGSGGTGLTSLGSANQLLGVNNGDTALEYKTISVGSAGTSFNISNTAGSMVFNLPDASATNDGTVNTTTQTLAGAKTFTSQTTIAANINVGSTAGFATFTENAYLNIGNKTASTLLSDNAASLYEMRAGIYYDGTSDKYSVTNMNGGSFLVQSQSTSANQLFIWQAAQSTSSAAGSAATLTTVGSITANGLWTIGYNPAVNHVVNGSLTGVGKVSAVTMQAGYTTTATAAGTTTLIASANQQQYFTGSTTQTLVLPVTSTLQLGQSYWVTNNSTGAVTVQSSGANNIEVLPAGATGIFTVILITGTTAASWSYTVTQQTYSSGSVTSVAVSGGTTGLTTSGGPITTSGTITLAGTLAIANGGTGQVTAAAAYNALTPLTTTGDLVYEASANTAARLAIGSTGQVLTVSGGLPVWSAPATSGTVTSVAMTVPTFLSVSGSPITSSGTLAVTLSGTALPVANGGTGVTTSTGTGSVVLSTSPTLVTPVLGTPTSVTLTNATGLPLSTGVTGDLPIANGGTGQVTAAAAYNALSPMTTTGDMEYEVSAATAARLPIGTTGQVLTVAGGVPIWATPGTGGTVTSIDVSGGTTGLTTSGGPVTTSGVITLAGTLAIANGGTGATSAASAYNALSPMTTTGDIEYEVSAGVARRLAIGTLGQVLTVSVSGVPSWSTVTGTGTVTSVAMTVPSFLSVSGSPITTAGTLAVTLSGTALPIANGGTGQTTAAAAYNALSPMTTTGDIEYEASANTAARLAIGSTGQVLTVSGGVPVWAAPATSGTVTSVAVSGGTTGLTTSGGPITSSGTITIAGTLAIANGGTGQTTAAAAFNALNPMTTTGDIIYEASANTAATLAIGSTGNVLTVSGGVPVWSAPATSGTVTSVAMSVPGFLSVSGSPITSSGTLAVSYSGTALPVANGGTAVTSVTTSPTATSFAGWDANKNLSANSFIDGYTTTATAGSNTTLTVSSTQQQFFTGTTTQVVILPVTSTLVLGQSFEIVNNSTGAVTVESSGSNTIATLAASMSAVFTVILTTGTTAASWSYTVTQQSYSSGTVTSVAVSGGTTGLTTSGGPITTSGTITIAGTLGVANGGTGETSFASNGILYGNGTSALQETAAGTQYQVLQAGSGGTPGFNAVALNQSAAVTGTLPVGNGGTGETTFTSDGVLYGNGSSGIQATAAGTSGQYLQANGSGVPAWFTVPAPTQQTFAANYYWTFTVSSANATAGATYTNNGVTYTVIYTISAGTTLIMSSPTTASLSGSTLTKASGTGDSTITESARGSYGTYLATASTVKWLKVRLVGAGGGGGSGGSSGSSGGNGGNTWFNTSTSQGGLVGDGGSGGQTGNTSTAGGAGGSYSISIGFGSGWTGGTGQEGGGSTSGAGVIGGSGASSPFGGQGGGGNTVGGGANNGTAAASNTGSGGGGGGGTATYNSGQGGGAGGFIDAIIAGTLASAYYYSMGLAGAGQSGGTGGGSSGAGGSGYIEVTEFYI